MSDNAISPRRIPLPLDAADALMAGDEDEDRHDSAPLLLPVDITACRTIAVISYLEVVEIAWIWIWIGYRR